jgi:rod shape-determining protein MreD
MPILLYFITWIAVTFIQVVVVPRVAIAGIYPDVLTATVIILALRSGRLTGLWLGFLFAISVDLLDPQRLGWMTLLVAWLGYGVGIVRDTIYIENPWFESTVVLISTFTYHLVYGFLTGPQFFFGNFWRMLAESFLIGLYTVIVIAVIIWLTRQRHTLRNLA